MLPGAHALFEVLAYAAGARCYLALRRRRGDAISDDRRWMLIAAAAAGALIGSRLLAALEHPALFFDPPNWLYYYANKTIVGGLLGGTAAVELAKRLMGERRRTGDLLTMPTLVGVVVGRIGCQLAGVTDGTAGRVTSMPWGMDLGDGLSRHPTALYEILFLVALGAGLWRGERVLVRRSGRMFATFMLAYLLWRLGVESLKPVEPLFAGGLSAIQWASTLGAIYFGWDLWRLDFWRLGWRGSDRIPTTT